jgi:four helix bundle protein
MESARETAVGGARSFTDLDVWQLSNELKLEVYALLRNPAVQRDLEYRDQMRNSAASAPRNIAEGFGRYLPRELSQYLRIANGSVMETSNHLQDGRDRGYFTDAEIAPLLILARRTSAAITRLIRYLETLSNRGTRTPNPRTPEPKNRNPST